MKSQINENKINQISTRSEYFQDILDKIPSSIIRYGSLGMLIIFIIIGIGLNFVKYPDVVNSEAIITTNSPPIEMHSQTSARISNILKENQSRAKKDEWIVILNSGADYRDIVTIKNKLSNININNIGFDSNIFENTTNLNLGELQASYLQLSKSINELKIFNSLNAQNSQLGINARQENQFGSLRKSLDSQYNAKDRETRLAKIDYYRNLKLDSAKVITKYELEQKEIAYLATKSNLERLKSEAISSKIQSQLLSKENISLKKEKVTELFKLNKNIVDNYNDFASRLRSWEDKYVIKAPTDGIIDYFDIRSNSQFLANEQKVFTITPSLSQSFYGILKIGITNSGMVKVGQKCIIKINNYPYTEYGIINGKIESISSSTRDGNYLARVKLQNQLITTLGKKLDPKSELTGQSEIVVEDLSLFDRIFNSLLNKNY